MNTINQHKIGLSYRIVNTRSYSVTLPPFLDFLLLPPLGLSSSKKITLIVLMIGAGAVLVKLLALRCWTSIHGLRQNILYNTILVQYWKIVRVATALSIHHLALVPTTSSNQSPFFAFLVRQSANCLFVGTHLTSSTILFCINSFIPAIEFLSNLSSHCLVL